MEDTKGNNGEPGRLRITNLRLLWCVRKNARVNLSIGLNCISSLSVKSAASRLKGGRAPACVCGCVLCACGGGRVLGCVAGVCMRARPAGNAPVLYLMTHDT